MSTKLYRIGVHKEQQYIKCLCCGAVSYSAMDIQHKYCGNCMNFLDMEIPVSELPYQARRSIEIRDYFAKAESYQELFDSFAFEAMTKFEIKSAEPVKEDYQSLSEYEMDTIDRMLLCGIIKSLKQVEIL